MYVTAFRTIDFGIRKDINIELNLPDMAGTWQ